jgi:hypothetical protein
MLTFVATNEGFHSRMFSFIKLETRKTKDDTSYNAATEAKGREGSCSCVSLNSDAFLRRCGRGSSISVARAQ